MPTIKIPTPLRPYTEGNSTVTIAGDDVSSVLLELTQRYPELKKHLYGDDQELRPFVNLFLGEDNIKDLQGLKTSLNKDDTLLIIPSIAGG